MAERATSLRWRLIALLLGAIVLVWLVTALLTYRDARREMNEVLDAHLAQSATLLVAQTSHELEEIETEHISSPHRYAQRVAFQIWEEGELRLHSSNAPGTPLGGAADGFSEREIEGVRWRVYSQWDKAQRFQIQVGEQVMLRNRMAGEIAEHLVKPLAIALPLLAGLIWYAVRRGLAPLGDLTQQIAVRDPDNLTPLVAGEAPSEVRPLVSQLNDLFRRVTQSIEQERRFTADAAHELRTPLAAIRAQAQVAQGATDTSTRERALAATVQGCDRATHLVSQLLTLARVDTAAQQVMSPIRLDHLCADVLAELAPQALGKGIELELRAAEVSLPGQPDWLRILLRNLVDNAIRYSPRGGNVEVCLSDAGGHPSLIVEDQGPGIPDSEIPRVMQRFYRVLGTDAEGSGLGLSIVQRIAQLHHATLRLEKSPRGTGLRAVVDFRPSSPTQLNT